MNIKSLLLGSAAALVAATGARAADAIVIAEPEPMEYVRICDMYGTGYFYIPGTENCLKIGGYYRYEMRYNYNSIAGTTYPDSVDDNFSKQARFAPNFTVKSETAWGTLTGFAELEFDWKNDGTQSTNLNHMYIEIAGFRLGKGDTPWTRYLGYGGPTNDGGNYGFQYGAGNTSELSYTFTGGNGFSAIIAVTEDADYNWAPDVSAGFNFVQGWGSIGAIAAYDESADGWAIKGVGSFKAGPATFELHGFWASNANAYAVNNVVGAAVEWSVLGGVSVPVAATLGLGVQAQYFSEDFAGVDDSWEAIVNLPWTPVAGLTITPELQYNSSWGPVDDFWRGRIRFQRSF